MQAMTIRGTPGRTHRGKMGKGETGGETSMADKPTFLARINDRPDCVGYRGCLDAAIAKGRRAVCPLACLRYAPAPRAVPVLVSSSAGWCCEEEGWDG